MPTEPPLGSGNQKRRLSLEDANTVGTDSFRIKRERDEHELPLDLIPERSASSSSGKVRMLEGKFEDLRAHYQGTIATQEQTNESFREALNAARAEARAAYEAMRKVVNALSSATAALSREKARKDPVLLPGNKTDAALHSDGKSASTENSTPAGRRIIAEYQSAGASVCSGSGTMVEKLLSTSNSREEFMSSLSALKQQIIDIVDKQAREQLAERDSKYQSSGNTTDSSRTSGQLGHDSSLRPRGEQQ